MDVKEALELIDPLVFAHTGKHLSDLEREIFIGSWQGLTYEQIYPLSPEYVEKQVGYKLWQKLSTVCGEKMTKKQFRGALERMLQRQAGLLQTSAQDRIGQKSAAVPAATPMKRVFISYRHQEPDLSLAKQFFEAIAAAGHQAFMAEAKPTDLPTDTWTDTRTPTTTHTTSPLHSQDWLLQIDASLKQCDYFLLLLSPQAAVSEMVIEELQQLKQLNPSHPQQKPVVLSIRVNCLPDMQLNHDLQNYLQGIDQREWDSPADTPGLVQSVLDCINERCAWGAENQQCDRERRHAEQRSAWMPPPRLPTPSPVADPELPQGQVRLDSAFYVERTPFEAQCYKEILQPGALIRIKAPRQMGKTSLMSRVLYQAREQGYRTVALSFQHADVSVFSNLNQLLQWFCGKVARKLRLPHQIDQYWTETYGSKDNCTMYFEDCLLTEVDRPLVLGLDEVDRIFQYPNIADDFFGLLRAWYEEAGYGGSDSTLWEKLRLVVVHSTEVYIPLDVNQSPFNVGLPIELSEFNPEQVFDLTQRHGLVWQMAQVDQLMSIVGGHPYLVRLALYHLAQQHLTLPQLLDMAPTEAGIYGDHLRRHLWHLQQHSVLANEFSRVVSSNSPVEIESVLAFKLHSLGLVHLQGNEVAPRFELYRQYFRERL
ncbi:MAG TPA: AAA-like domain-containing protein [Coleofasciculaceae cyanobacterium]